MARPDEPPGYAAGLAFIGTAAYVPLPGYAVGLEFVPGEIEPQPQQYLFPVSIVHDGVGAPSLRLAFQRVTTGGFVSTAFGVPSAINRTTVVKPGGISAFAGGFPTIWNRNQLVFAGNIVPPTAAVPQPTISLRTRYLLHAGANMAIVSASLTATHGRRTIQMLGSAFSSYGTPNITLRNRAIAPASIFFEYATNHLVGGLRFLLPIGFVATRFGTRIVPERQDVYPIGFVGAFGETLIANRRKVIKPNGITTTEQPADRWGRAKVFNLRQVISMYFDSESELNPPSWSLWTLIENKTRVMRPTGFVASRVAEPGIFNNARLLEPGGIATPDPLPTYKAGMVSYRIRTYRIEGLEPPYMSSWGRVHNNARLIAPGGFLASLFGTAMAVNTRRTFDRIGNFISSIVSAPMISYRVRELEFEGRYTIGALALPMPEVKLYTRYVDGIGTDMSGFGNASLSIHWTLITPRWTLQNLYGSPTVRNLTPELRTRGRNSEEFGDAFVRLEWRPVDAEGSNTQLFGRTGIAFRDRSLPIAGFRAGAMGDKLKVTKTGAPPYSTQFVWLDRTTDSEDNVQDGSGIAPPSNQVSVPNMNQKVLYVHQDGSATRFGSPRITANSIRVEPGYQELLVGEPMVSLKIRGITVNSIDEVYEPSKPRLSPNTIWAMTEAPEQAKHNHPTVQLLHPVDGYGRAPGAIFGTARVTLRFRKLFVDDFTNLSMGVPSLQNKRHYISLTGWTSMRFGWHTVPGPQPVDQYDSTDTAVLGTPSVGRPPYIGPLTIKGIGLNAQGFGTHLVEFFNREVRPVGYQATLMGTRLDRDTPYMWQGLRVGPLIPTIPTGFSPSSYGTPWVSFRVREVNPVGFNAFLAEYELEAFDKRMRVTRRAQASAARSITPVGIYAFTSSASDVKPGTHFIRPDGNADQHRKGAF